MDNVNPNVCNFPIQRYLIDLYRMKSSNFLIAERNPKNFLSKKFIQSGYANHTYFRHPPNSQCLYSINEFSMYNTYVYTGKELLMLPEF